MASKTIDHVDFYVDVKPYTTKDNGDQVFDVLNVSVTYRKGRGFRANYHPGWKTGWGGFGCIIDFSSNPLTSTTYVDIDPTATKNNVRRLEQYKANLELAAKGIAAYFDARNFAGLNTFIEGVALYGYTQHHKDSADFVAMKNAENNSNNSNSEDKTMKTNETKNENENVAMEAQVNNQTTDVDVAEVDDILPVVTKKKSEGRGKTEEVPQPSDIKPQTSAKVQDSVPQVRLVVYTTRHGDQAPRIDGFGGEDDPRWKRHYDEKLRLKEAAKEADKKNEKLKARMKGKTKEERAELLKQWVSVGSDPFNATVRTDFTTGDKAYFMLMGAKYMDAARQLVDAYNSGDEAAIAAAEQAVMDVKNGIVAERQAAREERKAAREANTDSTDKTEKPAAPAMSAQEQAMFDLFKKFMAGDATAMQQVGAMMAKQAA